MADSVDKASSLAHLGLTMSGSSAGAGVTLGAISGRGALVLRGDGEAAIFRDAIERVIGCPPPREANTCATGQHGAVLWLGPDEWRIELAAEREREIADALRPALDGRHAAVIVVGDATQTIEVGGSRARDVLQKGMTLDLHPRVFGPGRCARTLLGKLDVLVHQTAKAPVYEVTVHRSYAGFCWQWLADAAREYGYAIVSA